MEYDKDRMVMAKGISLPISTKQSIEICNFIKGRKLQQAKMLLEETIQKKRAIPFTRFNSDMGHKKGIASGRYPLKAATHIKNLLEAAEANAQFRGFGTSNLIIISAIPNKAARPWHYGRQRRRKMKRTTITIYVEEGKEAKQKEANEKGSKKETKKEKKTKASEEIKK